ncbi:MAG TPA: helix-turn-helix domain-containing protein, partial [Roseiflexaceae bacterium]|nr:helix-turn-helix domain-containing protein [Roseiflexaceae bacterium]
MGGHRVYRERKYAFGQQLLALRTQLTLTQTQLAEQIGVHRRSVQKWEAGESYPKGETLHRMLAVFVRRGAFTSGREHAEAAAFWNLAAEDGPHAIAPFDAAWFARMLQEAAPSAPHDSAHAPDTALLVPSPPSVQRFIDWGEVISVPTLYGRDSELETLHQWTVNDHCQVITILGIGGMGKSSLAITVAHQVAPAFDVVLFRSLQNGPPLAEVLDQVIRAVSIQHVTPPHLMTDKIARLVQLFREHRCLLILDNFEALLQDGALSGTYRAGYEGYRALVQSLGEREHGSCLMLTSREKPGELGPLEGRTAPVRTLQLTGLDARACQRILETKSISATAAHASAMAHFYGGNPLALQLVAEPIRDLFGGDVGAFLATGDAFFSGVGTVLQQQFTRSTPLEQAILRWLAIERELTDVDALLADLGSAATQRSVLTALESLRRRQLIERGPDQAGFTLQPFILEYLSDQLVTTVCQELVDGQIAILHDYALIQATAREYVRRSQERLIATPVLERLLAACGGTDAAAQRLVALLASWRGQPKVEQGHGPGNIINLLRLLRGNLNGLDCSDLLITHLYLQGTNARDAALTGSHLVQAVFDEPFAGIEAIACTPDMRYLAAGTVNGEVWVWEVATRNVLMAVHEHTSAVVGLALSADGRRLASGSGDGTVRLWEVDSARTLALFEHPTLIHSVALAEDGQLLASAGGDGVVRLWDVPSGVCLASMEGHTQAVWGVALAADGRLLASASFDGTARLWDLSLVRNDHAQPPRCLAILHGHRAGIYSVALSADARLLATGSADRSVRVWALPAVFNGVEQEAACIAILEGHTDTVRSVALSPDGHFVASGSGDGTARLWNVHTHACVTPFEGHTSAVWSVALSADGQLLASGSTDGTARLWDVRSGTSQMILNGRTNAVVGVALAPDSGMLASGGMDGTVQLWDVPTGTSLATLHGHSNMVVGTSFSPDGQRLASGSADGTVRLWDTRRGVCLATLAGHTNVVRSVAWSADGRLLASASYDGTIRLWDTAVALHDGPGSAACLATL